MNSYRMYKEWCKIWGRNPVKPQSMAEFQLLLQEDSKPLKIRG